jgi:hypothetical protein
MLDTNVFHRLEDRPDVVGRLQRLVDAGEVVLLSTHVQRDQLAAHPDWQAREELRRRLTVEVLTGGLVWDHSNWGEARWMPDHDVAMFEGVLQTPAAGRQSGTPGHTSDALIAHARLVPPGIAESPDAGRGRGPGGR